jgi:hypothetical protein
VFVLGGIERGVFHEVMGFSLFVEAGQGKSGMLVMWWS